MDKINRINALLEILRTSPRRVNKILLQKESGRRPAGEIVALAKTAHIPYLFVPKAALDKLSAYHQGVIALISPKEFASLDEIFDPGEASSSSESLEEKRPAPAAASTPIPFLLLLDEIEDPQNLGAILRSAECAGVDGVILPERRSAGLTEAVYEVSAGALEHLKVARVPNLVQTMERLKDRGIWLVGAESGGGGGYWEFDYTQPLGLVLGSEGKGLRPLVRKTCDKVLSIPMRGKVNSLNVASAASVFLFEVVRQRMHHL
jgi:23S rRNA (guanosine2251-2'-O)-methyltransferase